MRLFLAVEFSPSLVGDLELAIAPLRAEVPEIAWVPPEKRHLTLKFLGELSEAQADSVVAFTSAVAAAHRPFAVEIGGVGAFPNFRRARVVWIGVEQEPRLELLHHDLETAGAAEGFELEGRAFRPHVTLARVKAPLELERVRRLARAARRIDFSTSHVVSEIVVMESTLAPSGARYRRLHAATLGTGGR